MHCRRDGYFFAELPPGTSTGFAPATRTQLCVCLFGQLEVEASGDAKLVLGPGDVLWLDNTSGSGHAYSVKSEEPVKLLIVQTN
ncbi:cupin domain-containing protein [Ruegeria sp. AD91A]|uniref:cupin domain-containing protein n=1 Tax=Ruegeria sp. AD91A TaxID=2293862 RepID=UPI00352AD972